MVCKKTREATRGSGRAYLYNAMLPTGEVTLAMTLTMNSECYPNASNTLRSVTLRGLPLKVIRYVETVTRKRGAFSVATAIYRHVFAITSLNIPKIATFELDDVKF